ncbi:hypothetical protein E2562_037259 [Oryza meyeriana var. granulata]|uniref:Uncharacterized protein n=1 Tax=Oryza meyeriana var. granulata TaxID=110450 RepID=A0A6G1EDE5_9ORYZ|nr:hypothetical protein E2562_037259 [Oryza meyeriana var. granulata]
MATGTGSESVCASTGASPAATPVGTGESAPNPQPPATLALKETSTVAGGGGAANVVIVEEETGEDGTCTPAHTSEENADIEEFLYEDEVNRGEAKNQATKEGSGEDHEDSDLDDMDGFGNTILCIWRDTNKTVSLRNNVGQNAIGAIIRLVLNLGVELRIFGTT